MVDVGFSTGCLYKTKMPLELRAEFYKDAGATAIEVSFGTPEKLENLRLTDSFIDKLNYFNFISIHAPSIGLTYNSNGSSEKIFEKLRYLNNNLPIKGIVIHPDIIEDFSCLEDSGLPFLLENLNRAKRKGKYVSEFEGYNNLPFGYVLDVQHVYENDPTMETGKDFLKTMGSRLNYLHVSGENESSNHSPIYESNNMPEIEKMLSLCNSPMILEGVFSKLSLDNAVREVEFMRSFTSTE